MIATVTLNPAIDKTMAVPGLAIGRTNRATVEQIDAGGKGINVAKAVRQLGHPVVALGFLAGDNGRLIADTLAAGGIAGEFVWVPGETRVNLKIKDPETGTETEINERGCPVGPDELEALRRKVEEKAAECAVVVFSGSLPPGVPPQIYGDFIHLARKRGARTILDTAGPALMEGIAARPDLVKPNREEAAEALGCAIPEDGLPRAARRFLELGARAAVISLGAEGAVAASGEGVWRGYPPPVGASSSIGAGDAMVAVFAVSIARNLPFPEAFRLAMAAGAASAATKGSAAELGSIEDYARGVVLRDMTAAVGAC
jgi:1-phosphofructokinase